MTTAVKIRVWMHFRLAFLQCVISTEKASRVAQENISKANLFKSVGIRDEYIS